MALFGIAITILSGVLAYLAWNNGRWMKQSHQDAMALLEKIEKGQDEVRREVNETRREVNETRREVAETSTEVAEARRKASEAMAEARKEMAEAIKFLSQLVVSEADKTRQAVREIRA